MSPLLAQSGHHDALNECPLSGVKRTLRGHALMSAFDPALPAPARIPPDRGVPVVDVSPNKVEPRPAGRKRTAIFDAARSSTEISHTNNKSVLVQTLAVE